MCSGTKSQHNLRCRVSRREVTHQSILNYKSNKLNTMLKRSFHDDAYDRHITDRIQSGSDHSCCLRALGERGINMRGIKFEYCPLTVYSSVEYSPLKQIIGPTKLLPYSNPNISRNMLYILDFSAHLFGQLFLDASTV